MKERDTTLGAGPISIEVDTEIHWAKDGWLLMSYNTNPATGFLLRDATQGKPGLEILYWRQDREQNKAQFTLDAETGNIGIGAASPSDKLTIGGGGLSFQQAGQAVSEMGIDYDADSQSLRIRARKGTATALNDDVLTIKKDGAIIARGKINATGGLAVIGDLSAQSIDANTSITGKTITATTITANTITANTEVIVGNSKMTSNTVSAQKLTAQAEVSVGSTKLTGDTVSTKNLTGDTVSAKNLTATVEVSVGSTKLTSESVSCKSLIATDEIKASKIQGSGTGGSLTLSSSNLTLSAGQGVLTFRGNRVILGTDLGRAEISVLGNLVMDGSRKIQLGGMDENSGIRHGLSVFSVDGPVVYGNSGGVLGSRYQVSGKTTELIGLAWTQGGDIGIGTTEPGGMLEIKSRNTANPDAVIKFGGKNGDVHHLSSQRDIVFNSVKGEFYFRKLTNFDDLSTYMNDPKDPIRGSLMYIDPSGNVTIKGKLTQNCSREFKENISELTADEAMAALQGLNPVKYDYKDAPAFRQNLGFIAEEMPANLASEDRKSISPLEVIPVLTRVAKQQQQTIAALQQTVRALQAEVQQSRIATRLPNHRQEA